jgi:hypothetical protein
MVLFGTQSSSSSKNTRFLQEKSKVPLNDGPTGESLIIFSSLSPEWRPRQRLPPPHAGLQMSQLGGRADAEP